MFLNYKLQATNYKQTTNHKLQVLNACGEEHRMVSFISRGEKFFAPTVCNFGHCNLGFVCNLYFVICNFFPLLTNSRRFFLANTRSET